MNKEELLAKVRLYVIADKKICGDKNIEEVVSQAIEGGAEMIQYRDKESSDDSFSQTASSLTMLCRSKGVPLIINDRAEIALQVDADGVHLGQEDLSISQAREILGPVRIIGKSTNTIKQAKAAEEEGADYVGIGPIFGTLSKQIRKPIGTDVIREAKDSLRIPFFAIGGINSDNVHQIVQAGGRRIALISAVISSYDVKSSTAELLKKLEDRT